MDKQYYYWNNAGKKGYCFTYYRNRKVEKHNLSQAWNAVMDAASKFDLNKNSTILELGCGDGEFANQVLSKHYKSIDAYDYAPNSIKRAKANNISKKVHFETKDIIKMSYPPKKHWGCVFMLGILHHVKENTPDIINKVTKVTKAAIVLEPNGNSPFRKAFEMFIPSYKEAQEQSFKMEEIEKLFKMNGFKLIYKKHTIVVPWFTPEFLLPIMISIEKFMQKYAIFNIFNSTVILAFKPTEKKRSYKAE
jgi:cyclopropane fatty-acyl-phospholipid synthase-like methyltransferase